MTLGRLRTVLFTDIEGSSARWETDQAGMAVALAQHDELLAEVIESHGGVLFKHTGDGVCAAFDSPHRAVEAATEAQARLALPVRMGLHTGEVEARDGDFYGPALNRCARVMDAGHGGQVLVSSATAALLEDAELIDLGGYSLKGLQGLERIYQVGQGAFPPLRLTASSNIPVPRAPLFGRSQLLASTCELVAAHALVTLTGPGGVGKTRLAVAVARALERDFDAAFFVGLQEVEHDDVLSAVARALGLRTPTAESVYTALSQRRVLLLLDNCEHVVDEAAEIVEQVLDAGTSSHVLATSREGLAVDGERLIPVPPLPPAGQDQMAVELFIDVARRSDPTFAPDHEARSVVAEICDRLDGLPLAIELAAARTPVLGPAELLRRLDQRFRVLTGPRRRRSRDRQRTLHETVVWSYDLLEPRERQAFLRLGTFAGSFQLPAAASLLDLDELDVLDVLAALVDKSLLVVEDHPEGRRYRYLETIRAFAEEQLRQQGEADDALRLLHEHVTTALLPDLVERWELDMRAEAARLGREVPNLRACFDWALSRGDIGAATAVIAPIVALAAAIQWPIHGWADEVLSLQGAVGSPEEPWLRALVAVDQWLDHDFASLVATLDHVLAHEHTPRPLPVELCPVMYTFLPIVGRDDLARALREERLAVSAPHLKDLQIPRLDDEPQAVLEHIERELDRYPGGHDLLRASLLRGRAELAVLAGRATPELADDLAAAMELYVVGSGVWFYTLQLSCVLQLARGSIDQALELADLDIDHAYRIGDRSALILPMAFYAIALHRCDEAEAAATVRASLPRRLTLILVDELAELDRWLATRLDADVRAELAARGAAMEPVALRALARRALEPHLPGA